MTADRFPEEFPERSIVVDRALSGGPVSEDVIAAVVEASGEDPLELPQLGTIIDPDALDVLFDWTAEDAPVRRVTFRFAGFVVSLADGRVRVADPSVG